jgi:hypothetical protein
MDKQIANQNLILEKIEKNTSQSIEDVSIPIIKETPIIQPPINIEGFKLDSDSNEFISILEEKLKKMNLNVLSHKDNSDNSENSDNYDSEKEIVQLTAMFANQDINRNNAEVNPVYTKRSVDKYYYERPSPQDLLYEKNDFLSKLLFWKIHL